MKAVTLLLIMLMAAVSEYSNAGSFGIRFIVDDASLQSSENQDRMNEHLNQMVRELNAIYRDSEVDLTARTVDITIARMRNKYLPGILQEMQLKKGAFTDFVAKADRYKADFTVAIVPGLLSGSAAKPGKLNICGAAHGSWNLEDMMSVDKAYAVINPTCGAYSLAHELGHVMGLNHGVAMRKCFPNKNEGIPTTRYAFGYAEGDCNGKPSPEKFGDIMTGGLMRYIDGNPRGLNIFSNPRIHRPECGIRGICGDPETADAARALNENAKYFIKYRSPTS